MVINAQIPKPISFNPFKHHRNYILNTLNESSCSELTELYDTIGNNYMDIYTGNSSPEDICSDIIKYLKSTNVLTKSDFQKWVISSNNYKHVLLMDKSEWIIRTSKWKERYIHIHPAKTGPFTFRFKGTTLKTAYHLKQNKSKKWHISLESVNQSRMEIGLSPIKKLEQGKGILKCWDLFFKKTNDLR